MKLALFLVMGDSSVTHMTLLSNLVWQKLSRPINLPCPVCDERITVMLNEIG